MEREKRLGSGDGKKVRKWRGKKRFGSGEESGEGKKVWKWRVEKRLGSGKGKK